MFYKNDFSNLAQPATEEEFFQWGYSQHKYPIDNNLPPEVKTAWVNALREPERKQAKNRLQLVDSNGNKYQCCLGVLCELQGLKSSLMDSSYSVDDGPEDVMSVSEFEFGYGEFENGLPTESFMKSLGMAEKPATFVYSFKAFGTTFYQKTALSELNDDGFTFSQIADIIECFF